MNDMASVEKKYREAEYHLRRLYERSSVVAGDAEEIDFLLSAFLSAARSIDYRLRHEFDPAYASFHKSWQAALQQPDKDLLKFIADDRAFEVHEDGSKRQEAHEEIPVYGRYRDASGTVTVTAPHGIHRPTILLRPKREYSIAGSPEEVTHVCRWYLNLTKKLLADWKASIGLS